ncbi:hypothetical protein CEXT_698191 [Caerostris extrusa]|uniref:Uncharacterized protein n=1 Tax=Caerostris extrusa TaxID=172846 RepID=A0AAV4RYP6_CAEEX|nr:hypothetical protein CEXT_698191 [Caerostris extrusa]
MRHVVAFPVSFPLGIRACIRPWLRRSFILGELSFEWIEPSRLYYCAQKGKLTFGLLQQVHKVYGHDILNREKHFPPPSKLSLSDFPTQLRIAHDTP